MVLIQYLLIIRVIGIGFSSYVRDQFIQYFYKFNTLRLMD